MSAVLLAPCSIHTVTISQPTCKPVCVWACVWVKKPLKLRRVWPLPSCPTAPDPQGLSSWRDRVHGQCLCQRETSGGTAAIYKSCHRVTSLSQTYKWRNPPNTVILILWLQPPAAPRVAEFEGVTLKSIKYLCHLSVRLDNQGHADSRGERSDRCSMCAATTS